MIDISQLMGGMINRQGGSADLMRVFFEMAKEPTRLAYDYAALASGDRRAAQSAALEAARVAIAQGQLALERELGIADLGLRRELGMGGLAVERERVGIERERLGLLSQQLAADTQFRMAEFIASLRGPRNAFTQQAVLHGLNAAGLSNAVDAITTGQSLPTFQAPQAPVEPVTPQTFFEDTGIALNPNGPRPPAPQPTPSPIVTAPMPQLPRFNANAGRPGMGGGVPMGRPQGVGLDWTFNPSNQTWNAPPNRGAIMRGYGAPLNLSRGAPTPYGPFNPGANRLPPGQRGPQIAPNSARSQEAIAQMYGPLPPFKPFDAEGSGSMIMPAYQSGSYYVPQEGPAYLHQGEMVLPPNMASQVRAGGAPSYSLPMFNAGGYTQTSAPRFTTANAGGGGSAWRPPPGFTFDATSQTWNAPGYGPRTSAPSSSSSALSASGAIQPVQTPQSQRLAALAEQYKGALPAPNQIVGREWVRLPQSTRDFLVGGYEALGWSPEDVLWTINQTMPGKRAWAQPFSAVMR